MLPPAATPCPTTLRDWLLSGPALPAQAGVWPHLRRRLPRWLWLKALGTTAFMCLFFVVYFMLMRRPGIEPMVVPLTALDRWLPASPLGLVPYLSLWVYVSLPASLMPRLAELLGHGLAWATLLGAGLLAFYLWPTVVPRPDEDLGAYPGFALLQGVDSVGNACPSMHVASATFTLLWLRELLQEMGAGRRWRVANALWFAAIVWSTMAIRQHVAIDVAAGAGLGLLFALPALALHRRLRRTGAAGAASLPL